MKHLAGLFFPFESSATYLTKNPKNTRVLFEHIVNLLAVYFKRLSNCLVLPEVKAS